MINRFLCFMCRKDGHVGLAKTKCSGCERRFCDSHAGGSVRSFNDLGEITVEKAFCGDCAFRGTATRARVNVTVKNPLAKSGGWWDGGSGWTTGRYASKNAPIRLTNPGSKFFSSIPVEKGELKIGITDECFIKMLKFRVADADEVAGLAVIKDDTIVWATQCQLDSKSGGHVVSDTGQATIEALLAGHEVPNAQWHTHPGMSAFFSGTDTTDQGSFVKDVLESDPTATGEMTFVVFDTIDWKVSRIKWENGAVTGIKHGFVYLGDTKMAKPTRQWVKQSYAPATTVQPSLPGVTMSMDITQQAIPKPPKIISSLEEGVLSANLTAHDGYDDDYYDQLFGGWANIDSMIEGIDEDTGEVLRIDNGAFADLTFDDTAEYFEHFGVPYGDFGALMHAADTKYGKLWDWDLHPDVEGHGITDDDSDPRGTGWSL